MPRRRLRLSSYSDEEEEEEENQPPQEQRREHEIHLPQPAVSPQRETFSPPIPNPNPNPNPPEPVQISDDEFTDASGNFSPPSPPTEPVSNHSFQRHTEAPVGSGDASGNLSPSSHAVELVSNHSFQPPLEAPVSSGDAPGSFSPPLPSTESVSTHSFQPPLEAPGNPGDGSVSPIGEFLWTVGLRLRREWLDSCVHGLESSVPGFGNLGIAAKAKLCFEQFLFSDMNYSGGGILPENVDSMHLVDLKGPLVLQVDEIVNISCPLRGRYQDASPGIKRCLKLSMTDGVQRVFGMEYRPIKDLKVLAPAGLKVAICNVHVHHGLLMLVPEALDVLGGMVEELEAARQRLVDEINKPPRGKRTRTGVISSLATRATLAAWAPNGQTSSSVNVFRQTISSDNVLGHTNMSANVPEHSNSSALQDATPFHDNAGNATYARASGQDSSSFQRNGQGATLLASDNVTRESTMEDPLVQMNGENTVPNQSSNVILDDDEIHIDGFPISTEKPESNQQFSAIPDLEDVHMVDEVEHLLILSGDREIPFTYMASLSAKWAAMKGRTPSVQGRVKCFLTGVKGFQYKRRTTYELQVYVDDGSLISEILIDHSVVQKGIGHPPEEVTAALSSSDANRVSDMKETLRQFQIFLVNFEGTILVEVNGTSSLPLALEMNQGCSASDGWALLGRLKSSASAQTPQPPCFDPIDISP